MSARSGQPDTGPKPKRRRIFGKPKPAAAAAAGKTAGAPSQTTPQDAETVARLQRELLSCRQEKAGVEAKLAGQAQQHESQLMGMALRGVLSARCLCFPAPLRWRDLFASVQRAAAETLRGPQPGC